VLADLPIGGHGSFRVDSTCGGVARARGLLRFFDIPDIQTWRAKYASLHQNVAFRSSPSFESREGAVAAWLRQGEMEAQSMRCKPWNPDAFATQLTQVRGLTRQKNPSDFVQNLRDLCAPAGVAVVIVRAPERVSCQRRYTFSVGPASTIAAQFPLSLRRSVLVQLFHEAGHLLLHGRNGFFLEGSARPPRRRRMRPVLFAERILVPPEWRDRMLALGSNSREVIRFARRLGISPRASWWGQLQHYGPCQAQSLEMD